MKTIDHITHQDISVYGSHASKQIRANVVGLVPAYDGAIEHSLAILDGATANVQKAVGAARDCDTVLRRGVREKKAALANAKSVLIRFSRHLDTHPPGDVDRKIFFPGDGTVSGEGKTPARHVDALQHIASKLEGDANGVSAREYWTREIAGAATRLAPWVETTDGAKARRRKMGPELAHAIKEWKRAYRATKLVVASALRLTGTSKAMPTLFADLAVRAAPTPPEVVQPPIAANGVQAPVLTVVPPAGPAASAA